MTIERLRDLSSVQWHAGIAAWLGWMFDGLELHLYSLVATPFVAELLGRNSSADQVRNCGALIQAAFLVGWALGGGLFGCIGDRIGRSHTLVLTILTYALFTGLSFLAQAWWHLLVFRFLAALGIGGEWAVGATLLSETWPRRWGPWLAAVLQSAVNCGVLLAMPVVCLLSDRPYRYVFLVGVLPALIVVWIRRTVPEPLEWHAARQKAQRHLSSPLNLFRRATCRTTVLTVLVCGFGLSAHWSFMYWFLQHLRKLPGLAELASRDPGQVTRLVTGALVIATVAAIAGNFIAGWLARHLGYRRTIALMCLGYFLVMWGAYSVPRDHRALLWWFVPIGMSQGLFGLFTMYLPPLFPTLLRTTGAGFCYNIGRIAAGIAVVVFGFFARIDDYRLVLLYASYLFLPAAALALFLPESASE
ncbi:MAG: MFS transporter [Thermoguttaceae bacterium]